MRALWAGVILVFAGAPAQARVFDFNKETMGAYFRVNYALSQAGSDGYAKSSGAQSNFSEDVSYNLGGEIGFIISLANTINLRFGVEAYQTDTQRAIVGTSSSGTSYFTLTSKLFTYSPTATAEYNFIKDSASRAFFFFGMGWTNATLENSYSDFAAGNPYSITEGYEEKGEADVISWQVGVGYETLMVDSVTIAFEAGWRNMPLDEFKYTNEGVTTIQGDKTKGQTLVNDDGSDRRVDMGGLFVGLSFRFYIETL